MPPATSDLLLRPRVERAAGIARERPRARAAKMLVAIADRLAPSRRTTSAELPTFLETLNRLAQLDAEMARLRSRRPGGWANLLARYSAESESLRRAMALEFKRDDAGHVFLFHGETALYYVES